jgi:hypothetical protein
MPKRTDIESILIVGAERKHSRKSPLQIASKSTNDFVVLAVGSDPKPHDRVVLAEAQCTPVFANPHRVERLTSVNGLEVQARVAWIFLPQGERVTRELLNFSRQRVKAVPELPARLRFHFPRRSKSNGVVLPARRSSKASSAQRASWSCVRANAASQRASSSMISNCSIRRVPRASCAFGGSFAASSNAFFSNFVMTNNIHKTPPYFELSTPLPSPPPQGGRGKMCGAPTHA